MLHFMYVSKCIIWLLVVKKLSCLMVPVSLSGRAKVSSASLEIQFKKHHRLYLSSHAVTVWCTSSSRPVRRSYRVRPGPSRTW
ncbi:hypothetical protein GE21DRAFT_1043358 [Neurospora crassa]|nr:hypothetical protein GE21DRAFT_1043358 [Neurospora crassa]